MAKNDLCNNDNIDKDTNDITNDNDEVLGPGEMVTVSQNQMVAVCLSVSYFGQNNNLSVQCR